MILSDFIDVNDVYMISIDYKIVFNFQLFQMHFNDFNEFYMIFNDL